MRPLALALTILGALLASAASSERYAMTAGDLQDLCAGSDHVSKNVCRVYILGVTEGITVGMHMAEGKTRGGRPCIPDGVSAERLEQTLKTKLDDDLAAATANRAQDASGFIGAALVQAFPCARGASSTP
jgi:Rap1a immunity proteins